MTEIFVLLFLALFGWWFYTRTQRPKNFPPGPPRWPIIGSLPYVSGKHRNLLLGLRDLVDKYGPNVGFYLGSTPMVLVSDYSMLKEITKLDSINFRPSISPLHTFREGWQSMKGAGKENQGRPPGIVFSNGTYWKEQRKFLTRHLKDFGFGRSSLETLFDEELVKLCRHFKKDSQDGARPVNLMQPLKLVIISILWTILFGEQRDLNDPKLADLIRLIDEGLRVISPQTFLGLILPDPAMTSWPILKNLTGMDMVEKVRMGTNSFLGAFIKNHQQQFDGNNIRGFVDQQLMEIEKTTNPKSSFYGEMGYYAMFNNVTDIFLAGQDTTSSSILWTFLYLLHHPEVQVKIHKELDEVVGKGVRPGLKDRDNLHYLNAVILEGHRAISHVPLGVVREAQTDIKAGPYTIPKGASFLSGLYFIMNDPKHFDKPEIFNPDRFIDPVTGKFVPDEMVVPFGLGKRNCLGQVLGDQEFYIFLGGILSIFEICQVPGTVLPSYDIEFSYPIGMVRSAPKFDVILKSRVENF